LGVFKSNVDANDLAYFESFQSQIFRQPYILKF